jgi:hypothetical protein
VGGDVRGFLRREFAAGEPEVVVRLQVHPELGAVAEVERKPQRDVGADRTFIANDLADTIRLDAERFRQWAVDKW